MEYLKREKYNTCYENVKNYTQKSNRDDAHFITFYNATIINEI